MSFQKVSHLVVHNLEGFMFFFLVPSHWMTRLKTMLSVKFVQNSITVVDSCLSSERGAAL